MYYYFVWVRSNRYHGDSALTYSSTDKLSVGSIVKVELQKRLVPGVIFGLTTKPRFKTKGIEYIYKLNPIPKHLIQTATWLMEYYPAPIGILTQQLVPAELSDKVMQDLKKHEYKKLNLDNLPPLTSEQQQVLDQMDRRDTFILHGSTGSGKTRVYIEKTIEAILSGKSAIIMTPEISLVTQLSDTFKAVFGDRVVVMHSQQTPSERQRAWLRCLQSTQPVIVIGPRSILFSPVNNLGLIVMDESHENAYKQEQAPQYQTGRVASYIAGATHSSLILGSATPSITDYYLAEHKNKTVLRLYKLAQKELEANIKIDVIDKKDHALFDKSPYLSKALIAAIKHALSKKEQTLLYLNRRGTARIVLCDNCGWQALCPHCDIPLTYHGDSHLLRCHSCNHQEPVPSNCPVCKHPRIIYKAAGTKAIVEEVQKLFPHAKIARFDTDNLKAERFEQQYSEVKDGNVDIIVGTQLLAKGLDLPKLSTLGIVLADTSLYLPDFSAEERTFQLIGQVLGRIGRGHVLGQAIIQTYNPDHPVLVDAIEGNYKRFYDRELNERKQFMFPPFCYLLKITVRRSSIKSVEKTAEHIKELIEGTSVKARIEGPTPSFHERFQNKYQWQLVIKAKQRDELLKIIRLLPANISYDIDPMDLL
ncbi:MAG: primosomal protein N' [Candidatus Saccharimonadales bacterium]